MTEFFDKEKIKMDNTITFYQTVYVMYAVVLEFLNQKLYPNCLYFKNFSAYICKRMNSYETIFVDLYEKYKLRPIEFSPEMRLVMKAVIDSIVNHLMNILNLPQDIDICNIGKYGDNFDRF